MTKHTQKLIKQREFRVKNKQRIEQLKKEARY